jgi:hypothetical protein
MRKLVYDCYYENIKLKTVNTFEEAKKWKTENNKNSFKECLIDYTEEETKEAKEKRLAMIKKRKEKLLK